MNETFEPEVLELALPAHPTSVGVARHRCAAVARRLGAGVRLVDAIELCVTEAVTNAVRYAYPPPGRGDVHLSLQVNERGVLRIVIADDGVGIARSTVPGGLGRGLTIMEHLADEFRVLSPARAGTSIQLTFRLLGR